MTQQDSQREQRRSRLNRPILVALLTLLGVPAHAAEGDHIKLAFANSDRYYLFGAIVCGLLAIAYAAYLTSTIKQASPGSEAMVNVGQAIKDGALAYLRKQMGAMAIFGAILFVGLIALYFSAGLLPALGVASCFALGVVGSYVAGYTGMMMAVNGNVRVANAALTSYRKSLELAFRSGAVAGLMTVGIGLVGASLILLLGGEGAVKYLIGFAFGGSLAALFMRVGGGIFTKAADVGADLVGKLELGIPEDDPRNPAVIADNVGDNVGDCAGMAADVFESYEVTLISAIVLAAATSAVLDQSTWIKLVLFAMVSAGLGIIGSLIGIGSVRGTEDLNADPLVPIRRGFYTSAVIALVLTAGLAFALFGGKNAVTSRHLSAMSISQYNEARALQTIREQLATRNFDKTAIMAAVQKRADELRKNARDVSPSDLFADPAKVPAAVKDVPVVVIQNIVNNTPAKIEPFQITAADILRTQAARDMGLGEADEMTVTSALSLRPDSQPPAGDFQGFRLATPQDRAAQFAVPSTGASPVPGGATFTTVAAEYMGTGKDQLVVKQVHIKAQIPSQGGLPGRDIDTTLWMGPVKLGRIEEEIENNRKQIAERGVKASLEDLKTLPVSVFVGPGDRLLLGIPSDVNRPHALMPNLPGFYKADVPTMTRLQQSAIPGQDAALPPREPLDTAVANQHAVPWPIFVALFAVGIVLALAIEKLTDYYVSTGKGPTRDVAEASGGGPAMMIIKGFAAGAESSAMMVLVLVIALMFPLFLFPAAVYGGYELALFGVALVGLGLLSTTGYVLAMDTFGPISDNAQGVFEMSGAGADNENGAIAVSRLDAAGNTTKALTKGFAIATAVVAAIALFNSYRTEAGLTTIGLKLDVPEIFLGLLIGGAAPFLFSAFAINAVGRSAYDLMREARRQLTEIPGILKGTERPDYAKCVGIATASAQRELLAPGILAIALPALVGFGFSIGKAPIMVNGQLINVVGAQALGGFLAGAILSGQLMAVLLSNAGGIWDNAKKIIEDGHHGGKGSPNHHASVVGDTVGDPFKDTAGPALNPLIKVMNLVALLLAGVVILPLSTPVLVGISLVCAAALAYAVYRSKQTTVVNPSENGPTTPVE